MMAMKQLWKETFESKLITAKETAAMLQSGDSFCGGTREAKTIMTEIGKRKDLKNVTYYSSEANFIGVMEELGGEMHTFISFMDGVNREYVYKGWTEFIPCGFSGYDF